MELSHEEFHQEQEVQEEQEEEEEQGEEEEQEEQPAASAVLGRFMRRCVEKKRQLRSRDKGGRQEEFARRRRPQQRRTSIDDDEATETFRSLRRNKWNKIFSLQQEEGYWELTSDLGDLLHLNVDLFANEFLKQKGIQSLGSKAHSAILRLLASLLVLQLLRVEEEEEGKLLKSLFSLQEAPGPRSERWAAVQRAVAWVRWADRQYPSIYSRLEFGLSWESSTRQLLGYDYVPPFSSLAGLNLLKPAEQPPMVHQTSPDQSLKPDQIHTTCWRSC